MCLAVRVYCMAVASQRLDERMQDEAERTHARARDFEKQGKDDQACEKREPRANVPTLHEVSVRR